MPVATYAKGQKPGTEHTTITVDQPKTSQAPSLSEHGDRKAVAFDKSLMSRLTPTMKSFTLEGKVAVVTGYVPSWL